MDNGTKSLSIGIEKILKNLKNLNIIIFIGIDTLSNNAKKLFLKIQIFSNIRT